MESNNNQKTLEFSNVKPEIIEFRDLTYSQPSVRFSQRPLNLKLDILKPVQDEKCPIVLYIPGGGFLSVHKEQALQQRLAIAEAGFAVASLEYRSIPNGKFPEPLIDIKTAIRFLNTNSEKFGLERENIAVMGVSAGGYLAAMVGTTNNYKEFEMGEYLDESSMVKAVVDLYGLSDLRQIAKDFSEEVQHEHESENSAEYLFLNGIRPFDRISENDKSKIFKNADPSIYLSEHTPPFLFMHGDKDELVSPSQTSYLYEILVKNDISADRYLVKNAGHGGNAWMQPEIIEVIINYLNTHLKESY
ncbi:alpha/beta hydrolase fold domain-containing protein [Zunongwangia sp.]|uniref:alpha/beta hydrolase fold domain-containing protein n=1 Tax=Zunongwangia sp. TaxID=1965325 RepID=UPI003AA94EFB